MIPFHDLNKSVTCLHQSRHTEETQWEFYKYMTTFCDDCGRVLHEQPLGRSDD